MAKKKQKNAATNVTYTKLRQKLAKPVESPLTTYISRYLSVSITYFLIRTPITPNQVTLIGGIVSLLSAYFFTFGTYAWNIIAALVLFLAFIIDGVDGEIARFKGLQSKFGANFDSIFDAITILAVFFGVTIAAYAATGNVNMWILGFLAVANIMLINYVRALKPQVMKQQNEFSVKKKIRFGMYNSVVTGLILLSLINRPVWIVYFFAFIGPLLWIKQIYSQYKNRHLYE
jgi:phosphatidylglycerophosphate synthase